MLVSMNAVTKPPRAPEIPLNCPKLSRQAWHYMVGRILLRNWIAEFV